MVPRHFVSTDWTQLFKVFIIRVIHHFKLRHWGKGEIAYSIRIYITNSNILQLSHLERKLI